MFMQTQTQTDHRINFSSAAHMADIADESIGLVVTSPPYPMIEMWDECFCDQDPRIAKLLTQGDGPAAWERMHRCLDPVWQELHRVLIPGGFACINIGDATRTVAEHFQLYANHSRILTAALAAGFTSLPLILWRKQTNAPNKFMGSGMLPAGAYVTLEHEYILVLRKGGKRVFNAAAGKALRRRSAIFWEERNQWFSDVWFDIKGSRQALVDPRLRARSGAFPLELALRLILMYSVQGDIVLDPFLGTGTTMLAAMISGRSSVGYEIESDLEVLMMSDPAAACRLARDHIDRRLSDHRAFVATRQAAGKPIKHTNKPYGFPVITRQEADLYLPCPAHIAPAGPHGWQVTYASGAEPEPNHQTEAGTTASPVPKPTPASATPDTVSAGASPRPPRQRTLFG
jgi:DNA modification methylase